MTAAEEAEASKLDELVAEAASQRKRDKRMKVLVALALALVVWSSLSKGQESVDYSKQRLEQSQQNGEILARLDTAGGTLDRLDAYVKFLQSDTTRDANNESLKALVVQVAGLVNCDTRRALQEQSDAVYGPGRLRLLGDCSSS